MKSNTKHLKRLLLISSVVAMVIYIATCNLHFSNTEKLTTYKHMSTEKLIKKYDNAALDHLIEKAIEVKGTLKEVHSKNNIYTLYISDGSNKTYILCEMQKDQIHKIPHLKIGDKILVKGILKGHLLDIILLNCIII